jgi:Ca2+-binding EF-hand superfamily protein
MTSPSHGTTNLPQGEQPLLPPPSESQTNFSFTTTETQSTHFESFKERLATKQISPTVTTVLPKGPGEQWSPKHVDMSQFLQLCDLFLGEEPNSEMAESLASFLKRNYMAENSEELGTNAISSALLKMKKVHKIAEIFTLWDTDCSGYIHADEVIAVLSHWENFGTDEGKFQIETALEMLGMVGRQVSRIQFTALAEILTDDMTSAHFKEFVDVITTSIKLSKEQQQRNEFRQDLLYKIKKAGYNSTGEILPSLQAAVKAIQKDCINFGGNKKVSVIIGLLERNNEGTEYLHYKAASDDCLYNVIGKKVNHKQLPVSFGAIKGNIPIHIPNMYEHGKVHFFIPTHSNTKEFQGSLVVAPIVTPTGQSIGAISVDFIIPANKGSHNFMDHEIAFYQGVGVCLGEVYKAAIARKKLLGAAEAGILWLLRRCQAINQIDFYLIRSEENNEENETTVDHKDSNYLLQLALHSSNNMNQKIIHCNHLIRKKDNYFKEYLFNCVETSETVTAEVYCHQHLCCPLRDTNGCTIATLDLTLNMKTSTLDPQQARDINKMIKLLTTAFHQSSNSEDTSDKSVTLLFHQLLLSDLQTCMFKLDKKAFAELRSYNEPPDTILKIIQVLVMILHPDANTDTWNKCKPYINIDLLKLMEVYQPQADLVHPKLNEILSTLSSIVPNEVFRHGSLPAKYLYTWISACGAVLEHSNAGNIEITSEEKN